MSTIRAALYARFSTDKQRDASIEDQYRVCERTAQAAGLEVVARFEDKGISAGTAERPGYQALMTAARAHEFDIIVAEDVSRLWRNRAEFGPRSAELEDLGVHLLTCVGDDTRRDGWGMTIQLKQMIAEAQRREQSYRTRRGQEGVARSGRSAGGRAYGYIPAAVSPTAQEEIEREQAAVVVKIFQLYADGMSPRNIASLLNAEGVLSPGASWKRTVRRTDGKWLASAIHGDVKRGTGILNNRRYTGVMSWGRTEWTRSASDSSDRRVKVLESARVERTDERLRIVSDELWGRVKARQEAQRRDVGVRVRKGLRRHVRPAKHLLSGLLRCSACSAGFVLSNGNRYQCASHVNGDACSVNLSLPRDRAERRILDSIEVDLFNPARLADLEARYRAGALRVPVDHSRRIGELESEIKNVSNAIAQGLLSDALAARLRSAEAERGRLIVAQAKPTTEPRKQSPETVERRVELMRERLAQGGEIARAALRELFRRAIWLQPDESGKFLWALFEVGEEVLRAALFDDPAYRWASGDEFPPVQESLCVVAGAGFEACQLTLPDPRCSQSSRSLYGA